MMNMRLKLVRNAPEKLKQGVLYISEEYGSVLHLCPCGCQNEVITPLGPGGWQLTFNGRVASLYPSVELWSLPCRSHYWIRNNTVAWVQGTGPGQKTKLKAWIKYILSGLRRR